MVIQHLSGIRWRRITLLVLFLFPVLASAHGVIEISPYVAGTLTYDDNVFRFSSPSQAKALLGSDAMGDTTTREEVGVNVLMTPGRQQVNLGLNLNRSQFNRFGFLDNEGLDGKAAWSWRLGNHLNGELSINRTKSMAGFTEIRNPVLNMRTIDTELASLYYEISPGWTVDVLRRKLTQESSLALYQSSDYTNTSYEGGIQYQTGSGNKVSLTANRTDAVYFQRGRSGLHTTFSNDNTQQGLSLDGVWWATAKTQLTGHFGTYRRHYDELRQRDSSGDNKRMGLEWHATGKTMLSMSAWQENSGVGDLAGTYVNSEGWNISPIWNLSAKVRLQGQFQNETRDYQGGAPGALPGLSQRADELRTASVSIIYSPTPKVQAMGSWQQDHRKSNLSAYGYDDNMLFANVRIDFDF